MKYLCKIKNRYQSLFNYMYILERLLIKHCICVFAFIFVCQCLEGVCVCMHVHVCDWVGSCLYG